ncbi:MAG: antibiotic biosynthesis monooxygenase [Phocaeicola dorei]|nr:antibiotic biosynthesis monooxygenase [Phocaeicola dorei]
MVQIANITVDPSRIEEYKRILKEEMEASLRLENDVYVLYAVSDKDLPNRFTILEVYKDKEAYDRHFNSPHLQKYFAETKNMVQHLEISEVEPLIGKIRMK